MRSTRILAITGSLRAQSSNTAALHAVALLAPRDVHVTLFRGLDALPHFNPDLDVEGMTPPGDVHDFRRRVCDADALLISSPEYAHGVPGALKNALDWLVSVPELYQKPVGLLNVSVRSTHAHASLTEILRTMSMAVVPAASIVAPVSGRSLDAEAIARDPELAGALRAVIDALVEAVGRSR